MKKILDIDVIQEKKHPSWNETLLIDAGGSIGVLIDCVLDIKGVKGFFEMFDIFNKENDTERMRILFYNPYILKVNETKKFDKKLEAHKASVTNPEILKIITDYQAKKAADDLKKQKEEAEKKAKM